MEYNYRFFILVLLALTDILHSGVSQVKAKNISDSMTCDPPFQPIGKGCYYISDSLLDFDSAEAYCETLGKLQLYNSTLAMLGFGKEDDQAILKAVAAAEGEFYWFGGKSNDGVNWKWVDNRDVNPNGLFWHPNEPNEIENRCLAAESLTYLDNLKRSYIHDHQCSDTLNFVCQSAKCPVNFIRQGKYCYLESWSIGVPDMPWQEARDFCRSVTVFGGYYGDLAVLGLPGDDDYSIMARNSVTAWIGARRNNEECYYEWVDGRELPLDSFYWEYDDPDCTSQDSVDIYFPSEYSRPVLVDVAGSHTRPFICQMFEAQ